MLRDAGGEAWSMCETQRTGAILVLLEHIQVSCWATTHVQSGTQVHTLGHTIQ